MSSQGLKFSTALGIPCGVYDALEKRFNLKNPNKMYERIITRWSISGIFCVMPLLSTRFIPLPNINTINTSLMSRMMYLCGYNGFNLVRHFTETCYNAIKGEKSETIKHLKTAFKFAWRFSVDATCFYYFMNYSSPNFAKITVISEGLLLGFFAGPLKNGLVCISEFIDNKIIGKTSDERSQKRVLNPAIHLPQREPNTREENDIFSDFGGIDDFSSQERNSRVAYLTQSFLNRFGGLWRQEENGSYSKVQGNISIDDAANYYVRNSTTRHTIDKRGYQKPPKKKYTYSLFNPST